MSGRNLTFFTILALFSINAEAASTRADLGHSVGSDEVEDVLGQSTESGNSPYLVDGEPSTNVENSKAKGEDFIFNHGVKEVSGEISEKKKLQDFGYTMPGTFENQENYIEADRSKLAKDFRRASQSAANITFIKNDYDYQSNNDVINRTIGSGPKSVKGGALYVRHDSYMLKTDFLNAHWAIGAGVGFNSGKGIFVDGTRSDATFKLWEIPLDAGLGMEIPIGHWFKISGTGGPSVLGLVQNRSDFQRGEKGKRKIQYSPGYFANAQFKINLAGFSEKTAYQLFSESEITNLFMNLEIRHQSYENFQDEISVSGTSFGVGFTFEYL